MQGSPSSEILSRILCFFGAPSNKIVQVSSFRNRSVKGAVDYTRTSNPIIPLSSCPDERPAQNLQLCHFQRAAYTAFVLRNILRYGVWRVSIVEGKVRFVIRIIF